MTCRVPAFMVERWISPQNDGRPKAMSMAEIVIAANSSMRVTPSVPMCRFHAFIGHLQRRFLVQYECQGSRGKSSQKSAPFLDVSIHPAHPKGSGAMTKRPGPHDPCPGWVKEGHN